MKVEYYHIYDRYSNGKDMVSTELNNKSLSMSVIAVPCLRVNSYPIQDELFYEMFLKSGYAYFEELDYFAFFTIQSDIAAKSALDFGKDISSILLKSSNSRIIWNRNSRACTDESEWYQICIDGKPLLVANIDKTDKDYYHLYICVPKVSYAFQSDTLLSSNEAVQALQEYCNTTTFYK